MQVEPCKYFSVDIANRGETVASSKMDEQAGTLGNQVLPAERRLKEQRLSLWTSCRTHTQTRVERELLNRSGISTKHIKIEVEPAVATIKGEAECWVRGSNQAIEAVLQA